MQYETNNVYKHVMCLATKGTGTGAGQQGQVLMTSESLPLRAGPRFRQ